MSLGLVFLFLCALASVTVAEDTPRCPVGFVQHGSSCYWISNIEGSFAEASSYCQFFGSHLARITSKDENDLIRSHAEKSSEGYWLGATDLISNGTFVWEGGFPLNYTNWRSGEPNGNSEHCLVIEPTMEYMWNDLDCIKERKFICERCPCVAGKT